MLAKGPCLSFGHVPQYPAHRHTRVPSSAPRPIARTEVSPMPEQGFPIKLSQMVCKTRTSPVSTACAGGLELVHQPQDSTEISSAGGVSNNRCTCSFFPLNSMSLQRHAVRQSPNACIRYSSNSGAPHQAVTLG